MGEIDTGPIRGKVLQVKIIPPQGYFAAELKREQVLRILDIEGQQVADLVCFNLHRLEEKLSPENTINLNQSIYPHVGYSLASDEAGKLMTIVADTCGTHDMLAGACSRFTNELRYREHDTPNCRDNLAAAVKPWGITWKQVPYNMNVFMNCPVEPDGTYAIQEPKSKAGDYVDLQANMDVLVALSNCPQVRNPCNAYRLTPLMVVIYHPEGRRQVVS